MKLSVLTCSIAFMPIMLGGCWSAETRLIDEAKSVEPVHGGDYVYHTVEGTSDVTLTESPEGGYNFNADDLNFQLLVHEMGRDWFLLQAGKDEVTLFGLAHLEGTRATIYSLVCDEQDEEIASIEGIDLLQGDLGPECSFANLDSLDAAAELVVSRIENSPAIEPTGWVEFGSTRLNP